MEIKYHGHSCFEIKNKGITVITDPYSEEIGLKLPKLKANIVTVSHDHYDHNNISAIERAKSEKEIFVTNNPGGYEVEGVLIEGIASFHDDKEGEERGTNTIFNIKMGDITLCHLGDLGTKLTDVQTDEIDGVDILFVPVGGIYTIDAKTAADVVNKIEPRIVIPMHYKTEGLKIELEGVDKFIKEMGMEAEKMDTLKIEKKDLPQEEMKLIVLNKA